MAKEPFEIFEDFISSLDEIVKGNGQDADVLRAIQGLTAAIEDAFKEWRDVKMQDLERERGNMAVRRQGIERDRENMAVRRQDMELERVKLNLRLQEIERERRKLEIQRLNAGPYHRRYMATLAVIFFATWVVGMYYGVYRTWGISK